MKFLFFLIAASVLVSKTNFAQGDLGLIEGVYEIQSEVVSSDGPQDSNIDRLIITRDSVGFSISSITSPVIYANDIRFTEKPDTSGFWIIGEGVASNKIYGEFQIEVDALAKTARGVFTDSKTQGYTRFQGELLHSSYLNDSPGGVFCEDGVYEGSYPDPSLQGDYIARLILRTYSSGTRSSHFEIARDAGFDYPISFPFVVVSNQAQNPIIELAYTKKDSPDVWRKIKLVCWQVGQDIIARGWLLKSGGAFAEVEFQRSATILKMPKLAHPKP